MKLSTRQLQFCKEYIIDLNAAAAARRAGYAVSTADQAIRLLGRPTVAEKIKELMANRAEKVSISADTVLSELLQIAKADISGAFDDDGNLKDVKDIPENIRRTISSVEVFEEYQGSGKDKEYIGQTKKIKFWDKTKSLELLGRHLALFTDKLDHSSKDGSMSQKPQVVLILPINGSEAK